jgi:AcrR family transcriptional regulator
MRRVPQQARAQRRVEAILDAASFVIGEVGCEAVTTNMIAERASTSIGSIYQFFQDKEAIISLLCDRYAREVTTPLTELSIQNMTHEGRQRVLLDVLSTYIQENPGFGALLYGTYSRDASGIIEQQLMRQIIPRIQQILSQAQESVVGEERLEICLHVLARFMRHRGHQEETKALLSTDQQRTLLVLCLGTGG